MFHSDPYYPITFFTLKVQRTKSRTRKLRKCQNHFFGRKSATYDPIHFNYKPQCSNSGGRVFLLRFTLQIFLFLCMTVNAMKFKVVSCL